MKSERRHELESNELAEMLSEKAVEWAPYFKYFVAGAVVLVVASVAIAVKRGQDEGRTEAAWAEYFAASEMSDVEGLREIADRFSGTEAAAWAMQSLGDIQVATGSNDLFFDKESARKRLEDAKQAFTEAIRRTGETSLEQRAHMGLAQAYEALNQLDDAKAEYDTVINGWPDTALAQAALDRRTVLEDPETVQFSDWFAKYEPPKKDAIDSVMEGGAGIRPPTASDDLPDVPELSLPTVDALEQPKGMDLDAPQSGVEPPEESDADSQESAAEGPAANNTAAEEHEAKESAAREAASDANDPDSSEAAGDKAGDKAGEAGDKAGEAGEAGDKAATDE